MNKEQIIEFIRQQEVEMYKEYKELRAEYGADHAASRQASAQWNAVSTLLELIEDEINENN